MMGGTKWRRVFRLAALFAVGPVTFLITFACSETGVGRLCDIGVATPGTDASVANSALFNSQALECPSRVCLHAQCVPGAPCGRANGPRPGDLCTAPCSSNDDCADGIVNKMAPAGGQCTSGFSCTIASETGPFCCRRVCVCNDFLFNPDGGAGGVNAACDPSNPANLCVNIR
jgi:hypothetical protein